MRSSRQGESPSAALTLHSVCSSHLLGVGEAVAQKVDEDKECHGADWQGLKEPYQEELTPSMKTIRAGCHHAIRLDDGFHHGLAEAAPS
eukprot:scaffold40762_cov45-Phaeocystis_antarctica.AAC.2